jgi:hypothetical protein
MPWDVTGCADVGEPAKTNFIFHCDPLDLAVISDATIAKYFASYTSTTATALIIVTKPTSSRITVNLRARLVRSC